MAKVRVLSMAIAVAWSMGAGNWGGLSRSQAAEPPEPAVGGPGAEGDYLRVVHEKLHPGWVDGYIRVSPYKVLGPANSQRMTEVSIVIRWDGTIDKAEITKSSGADDFDAAALNAVLLAAPFPPPVDVMADDGLVHLKWQFARNYRLCSGAEMARVEYPLQLALPALASRGQLAEAIRRMRAQLANDGWTHDFLSPFIKQWLGRSNLNSELDARAAAALAGAGDRGQIKVLKTALLSRQTAAVAGPALERAGEDVADILTKALATAGEDLEARRPALLEAIRATPGTMAHCPACAQMVAAAAVDPRQPARARVELIQLLASAEHTDGINQALALAAKDGNAAVRGAALFGQIPPGRGRPAVIRMAALLRDPAPEIRAAAAAGVLRAGGDSGLEQLYLLSRDRDVRPLVAAAGELGHLSSEASADMLRRLLKRPEKAVRVAVVAALAGRSDAAARGLVDPILHEARQNSSEEAAVRQLALNGSSAFELMAMSNDARLGLSVYEALLNAQLRAEGAQWLVNNVERLSPEERITAFGDWIAEPIHIANIAKDARVSKVATAAQQ
ncbi:MAG: TonB family protein [Myxococcales bacterium]